MHAGRMAAALLSSAPAHAHLAATMFDSPDAPDRSRRARLGGALLAGRGGRAHPLPLAQAPLVQVPLVQVWVDGKPTAACATSCWPGCSRAWA